jgi:hypothetical protein
MFILDMQGLQSPASWIRLSLKRVRLVGDCNPWVSTMQMLDTIRLGSPHEEYVEKLHDEDGETKKLDWEKHVFRQTNRIVGEIL